MNKLNASLMIVLVMSVLSTPLASAQTESAGMMRLPPQAAEMNLGRFSGETYPYDSGGVFRWRGQSAAFLLVMPGAALIGMGVGLLFDEPGPGLIIGAGSGALIWGMTVALK